MAALKSLRDDEGGAMAEFAIAMTIFIVVLLGVFEFGYSVWQKNSVAADAREGARYAIVHGAQSGRTADSTMVANYVKSRTALGSSIIIVPTWSDPTSKKPGSTIAVKVKHAVSRVGPFLAAHTDSSTATMTIVF